MLAIRSVGRFEWLDSARGIAALIVVLFHYHHFYLIDYSSRSEIPPVAEFPYATFFSWAYSELGATAVQFFWLLSGFVFFHVYLLRLSSLYDFAVARIARLYPLHIATLFVVAAFQWVSLWCVGHWQIYGNNDIRHFILQLFMTSNSVSLSRGLSFNGPIWSVSLEVVSYAVFFLCLPLIRLAPFAAATSLLVASALLAIFEPKLPLLASGVWRCAMYFFAGGVLYTGMTVLSGKCGRWLLVLVAAAGALAMSASVGNLPVDLPLLFGCLCVVTLLATFDALPIPVPRAFVALGDMSYAVYLTHVPVQILWLLFADYLEIGRAFADSLLTLPAYIGVVLIVSYWVHYRFEVPAGHLCRVRLRR